MKKIHLFVLTLFLSVQLYCHAQSASSQHPWFKAKKINEKVWRISDGDIDNIYLIEGRDSALLIDTGIGAADLNAFVKSITSIPVIVVNTHSHPDHSGGDQQFAKVYAHPDDFKMLRFFGTPELRRNTMKMMGGSRVPDSLKFHLRDSLYYPVLIPVEDGKIFDLGDRKIEVIHVPGHTPGSICLFDHKDKVVYTGDNDNGLVWLHPQDALPLDVYLKSLQKLQRRDKEFSTLFPGHGEPVDKTFIQEQIACAEEIIGGKCVGKPYDSFVGKGLVCGYKRAQIAYDPTKIKSKK
jgi:hydroxyacylglutathione hydrolase